MLKKDYFLQSIRDKAHYAREWMLRCFSIVIDDPKEIPWALKHTPDTVEVYVPSDDGSTGTWTVLEDCIPYEIPFVYHESAGPLKKGDILNLDRDILDTTWGTIIINVRVLCYACGDIIKFMEGPFTPMDIENIFVKEMKSNPKEGEPIEPGQLYVFHWLKVGKAVGDLDGFEFVIPSVTEHALQPYPGMKEHRKELLGRYTPDELEDPVIQTKIQNEMVARYKEYLKGDPSEGFIFKDKTIGTSLKQMFLIHGPEAGFQEGGRAKLVPTSLDEGINLDYFPEMMNSLRAGAYFRGAMTALAGTDVDLIGRIFQNSRVKEGFCGTTDVLLQVPITKRFIGRWMRIDGKRVQLTDENLKDFIDTKQDIYDPSFCKAEENDICSVCIGQRLADYPTSLGSAVTEKQSVLMSVMMASAHAKELKTVPLKEDWLE